MVGGKKKLFFLPSFLLLCFCCFLCYFFLLFLLPLLSFLFGPHPSLHVSILCLYAPLPPSSPRPLPVSAVYEGKFIGLPGAVGWRWPPLLKPQQGFTLHVEKTRRSGHTGLFPSAHITPDNTHSYLQLPANEPHCFFCSLLVILPYTLTFL